jgi:hypothetical protein
LITAANACALDGGGPLGCGLPGGMPEAGFTGPAARGAFEPPPSDAGTIDWIVAQPLRSATKHEKAARAAARRPGQDR